MLKAPMYINLHTKFQLGFSKFQFFNGQNGEAGGTASLCQILAKYAPTAAEIWRFFRFLKMADVAMLDF